MEESYLRLSPWLMLNHPAYTGQVHLPRVAVTHSGLGPLTLTDN